MTVPASLSRAVPLVDIAAPLETDDNNDIQQTTTTTKTRVKRVYRRQLSVPLVGNDDLLEEAGEAFSGDDAGFKEACHAHAKASKMVSSRLPACRPACCRKSDHFLYVQVPDPHRKT